MNRAAWSKTMGFCFWPDCNVSTFYPEGKLTTHEVVGGPMRARALNEPAAWLRLCRAHHRDLPSVPNQEQLTLQLAMKRHFDREHYDLQAVLRLWRPNRGRWDDGPITEAEVREAEKKLFGERIWSR